MDVPTQLPELTRPLCGFPGWQDPKELAKPTRWGGPPSTRAALGSRPHGPNSHPTLNSEAAGPGEAGGALAFLLVHGAPGCIPHLGLS